MTYLGGSISSVTNLFFSGYAYRFNQMNTYLDTTLNSFLNECIITLFHINVQKLYNIY